MVGRSGDLDGSADDGGVAVVEALPEPVADNDDFLVAVMASRGGSCGRDWLDAEDIEEFGQGDDFADEARVIVGEADAG